MSPAAYAQTTASPQVTPPNCDLAQKELDLIKSELDVVIAKYKISIKDNISNQLKAGGGSQKVTLSIDGNNDAVKAISKLSIAGATYAAMLEMCKDGLLKPNATTTADGYKAQLVPEPTKPVLN